MLARSIRYASIDMQGKTPLSSHYDDIYYSKACGVEESLYVFVEAQELHARMHDRTHSMHVGELGFGTGLNAALLAHGWMHHASQDAQLYLWSVEKHPIEPKQLAALHESWSEEFQPYAQAIQRAYPLPIEGVHSLWLVEGRVHLSLCFGDVMDYVPHLPDAVMDGWLLDGFAPAKNPDMWSSELLHHIGRASAPDATISTFTAASHVRRALEHAGYTMRKIRGFGRKRHMLVGRKIANTHPIRITPPKSVLVIGAGIAGANVAYACAQYGMNVRILEANEAVAQEASGNPAGIIYPYMSSLWDAATLFYMHGFSHLVRLLDSLGTQGTWYDLCGAHYYPKADTDAERQRLNHLCATLGLDASIAYPTKEGCMLPASGWIAVPKLVEHLLRASNSDVHCATQAVKMHYDGTLWHVQDAQGRVHHADAVVLANAYAASTLLEEYMLPMRRIHGQITYLPEHYLHDAPAHVLCHQGYSTPAIEGIHYIGATFDPEVTEAEVTVQRHQQNLSEFQQRFPQMLPVLPDAVALQGRSAFRTVSGDRFPIVGMLYEPHAMHDATRHPYHPSRLRPLKKMPHLYVTLAHGARGLVSAPLAGVMIAAQMQGVPMVAHPLVKQLLDPTRFIVRAWKKCAL